MVGKVLVALVLAGIFGGCAFSNDPARSVENDKEQRDSDYLNSIYSIVTGTYEGQMVTYDSPARTLQAKMGVYTQEENAGQNSNGEIIVKPVLYTRVEFDIYPTYDSILKGKYFPESGDVKVTNIKIGSVANSSGTSNVEGAVIQTIVLHVSGKDLVGDVKTAAGPIGKLTLHRTADVYTAPSSGDLNERYERIRKLYEPILGNYYGNLVPDDHHEKTHKILIRLFIRDLPLTDSVDDGSRRPVLTAYYEWADVQNADDFATVMGVDYRLDEVPTRLLMSSLKPGPNNYVVNFDARLVNGQLKGRYSNQLGSKGSYVLTTAKAEPTGANVAEDLMNWNMIRE